MSQITPVVDFLLLLYYSSDPTANSITMNPNFHKFYKHCLFTYLLFLSLKKNIELVLEQIVKIYKFVVGFGGQDVGIKLTT